LEAANRVFSLVVQAKRDAEGGVPALPAFKVEGLYKDVTLKHSQPFSFATVFPNDNYRVQTERLFDRRAKEQDTLSTPIYEWREGIQTDENASLLMKFYALGEKLPPEVWGLLKEQLSIQLTMPIRPVNVYGREDLHRTVGLNTREKLWDLRVRFTDFLRRFLTCYRSDPGGGARVTPDPFTVFFVEPRNLAGENHIRSGLFGHAYVIDEGQRQYLEKERQRDDSLPTDVILTEYLPFPDGLCTKVYLSARSSDSNHVGRILEGYIGNNGELRRLEETLLQNRALMEIPIYDTLPMPGGSTSDGPRLILCIAIPNPESGETPDSPTKGHISYDALANTPETILRRVETGTEVFIERATRPVALIRPMQSPSGAGYIDALKPPSFSSYGMAEEQVVREMAHKMTKRYLSPTAAQDVSEVIGISTAMLEVKKDVARLAIKDSAILITGESGTGKTRLAEAIHLASPRAQKPFKEMPTYPAHLIDGYLFGWKKGAHSEAKTDNPGYLLSVASGTFVINDVDTLPLDVQEKLLTFIREKKFIPMNGTAEVHVDVRIIATTNQDLHQMIQAREFREDLYNRLAQGIIQLPALRDRKEDIPIWAEKFLRELSKTPGGPGTTLTSEAMEVLTSHDWMPGNLAKLREVLDTARDLATDNNIGSDHVSAAIAKHTLLRTKAVASAEPIRILAEMIWALPGSSVDEKLAVARGMLMARELKPGKS
jgi:DNA-binding NtrC family response regulator